VVTTTTSTSTSMVTLTTATTTTSTSTSSITSTSSTSTTTPPVVTCDPGPPGSPNNDCCSESHTVIENRIGLACGTRLPAACELGDVCTPTGVCAARIISADPPTICRNAFQNGPCDRGDVCDGQSPECPTTGDVPCITVGSTPDTTEFTITCVTP